MNTSSENIRDNLISILNKDNVGPLVDNEKLPFLNNSPLNWYLTGFLSPSNAPIEDRSETIDENDLDELSAEDPKDGNQEPEKGSKSKKIVFPSSIGMSFFVSSDTQSIKVKAEWGDYKRSVDRIIERGETTERPCWERTPYSKDIQIKISDLSNNPKKYELPKSRGVYLVATSRNVNLPDNLKSLIPSGTKTISVFLVNERERGKGDKEEDYIFQASIKLETDKPIVPRPNLVGFGSDDIDLKINDLQYRSKFNYSTGHGVSTYAREVNGECKSIETRWIPEAEVEKVIPNESIANLNLSMKELGEASSFEQLKSMLSGFVTEYDKWIKEQSKSHGVSEQERLKVVEHLLGRADSICKRLEKGIEALKDEKVFKAFTLANKSMYKQAAQRLPIVLNLTLEEIESKNPISWRPFQLAFVLINILSISAPEQSDSDRDTVDLLFFPTGGGKTEAYLGLAAFTLFYRRLSNEGISSAGTSIIMRYTLRLLTLDQLSRASALICAMELERLDNSGELGEWPFEIGLWVGMAATPNKLGRKGNDKRSARERVRFLEQGKNVGKPLPLENCPWCDTPLHNNYSFRLDNLDNPKRMFTSCVNQDCDFSRVKGKNLPIISIDEEIYRRLPSFVIATVDKFASMPFDGKIGGLFGKVQRYDQDGFYGASEPGKGQNLPAQMLPPDLIIQDELHLISGPLGTMVGLYETVIDELSSYIKSEKKIRPKIVASTATVRRADTQIRGLFNRSSVEIFPPPGPDIRDSFFAKTVSSDKDDENRAPARKYIGVAAMGRPLKVIYMRTYLTLMSACQYLYKKYQEPGKSNPVDPYMTVLGYFNSLRELGGSRRIVEDDLKTKLASYGNRKRLNEDDPMFKNRNLGSLDFVMELTSRVSTSEVAEAKARLSSTFEEADKCVDVALATNMISVGLDIPRLGLMVSTGQPKTTSEYIQATSRVGRDSNRPGLVVTLYSLNRHRDRSHYENFQYFHETFYRDIEATSVTPFSPRALDKGLAGAIISLVRLGHDSFTPGVGAMSILDKKSEIEDVVNVFYERAGNHKSFMDDEEATEFKKKIMSRVRHILDRWYEVAKDSRENGVELCYAPKEVEGANNLLQSFLDEDILDNPMAMEFRVNRSMRDVEQVVDLEIRNLWHGKEKENVERS